MRRKCSCTLGLRPSAGSPATGRRRKMLEPEWEERLPSRAVEEQRVGQLRDLRDGVHFHTIALDRDEIRRRGNVPVPDVVADFLKVPEPPAGERVERDDAVGEKI